MLVALDGRRGGGGRWWRWDGRRSNDAFIMSSNEESDGDALDLSPVVHSAIKKQQRCLEGCSMYH